MSDTNSAILSLLSLMERMMDMQERLVDQLEKVSREVEHLQTRLDEHQIGQPDRNRLN